jgi:hypothetical protein
MELASKYFDLGHDSGMRDKEIFDLAHEFFVTHPGNWEVLLEGRLKERADQFTPEIRAQRKALVTIEQKRIKVVGLVKKLAIRGLERESEYLDRAIDVLEDGIKGKDKKVATESTGAGEGGEN